VDTKKSKRRGNRAALALSFALFATHAFSQEEKTAPESTPAGPRPSVVAAKAAQNLLTDIALVGEKLVAVGEEGVILTSADGTSWTQVQAPVDVMLTRLRFADAQTGWALGYDASILRTKDGGKTWTLPHFDAEGRALFDLLFTDPQHGLAVGAYGGFLVSEDGGTTWTKRESDLSALGMHLNQILKLGDGSLLVVGERGLVARSSDHGVTWQILDFPYGGTLFGALPRGDRGVTVYGMRGNVFVSEDVSAAAVLANAEAWDPYSRENHEDPARIAALGWRKVRSPIQESLFGGVQTTGGAVLLGVNGTALTLDANAGTLEPLSTPAKETLMRAVAFKGRLIGVGKRGAQNLGAAP
jgi:photosystem II stability/assembly factor-like uncharacterized protein